nr:MbcA/ParS/Xre antitoxin family protein [Nitrospira moscoviensis]
MGSAEKANSWFYRPNKVLKDRTPFSLLSSVTGVKRVMKALNQKSREGQKEWAVTQEAALQHAEDPPLSLFGTKTENARVEGILKRIKGASLPVQTSLKKMKTFARRKAHFVSTIRKATD